MGHVDDCVNLLVDLMYQVLAMSATGEEDGESSWTFV